MHLTPNSMHVMERTMRNERYPQRRKTPSFSSTLLDTIYRSIDESKSNLDEDPQLGLFKETTTHTPKPNHNHNHSIEKNYKKEKMNLRKAVMIEDWMEKQTSHNTTTQFVNSTPTSSSETDTTHKPKQKLKQKVKQPISPGTRSRIASFLSSIFNTGNVKKPKMCYVGAVEDVSFDHKSKSPCFSSSTSTSFSRRSCMSKTPSTCSTKGKRSVRFYPVSVILGEEEDSHSYGNDPCVGKITRGSSMKGVKKKNYEVPKENGFMKGCQNSCKGKRFGFRGFYDNGEEGDDDDDDDALSYSSSDLFELDHLIGAAGRYREELPVYETTNLETNKAIANGLCL